MRNAALLMGCLALLGCSEEEVGASSAAVTSVPEQSAGRSTIENRHVYADPDEGTIEFQLSQGLCLPNEFCMRGLEGEVNVRIDYSRAANTVELHANWTAGAFPYRPTYEKDFDDSTEFNPQFMRVEDARWQMWMMGSVVGPGRELAYYDATTLQLLGTRYDFEPLGPRPWPAEGTYFTIEAASTPMICTPIFESEPDGSGSAHFTWRFDRMEDAAGSPGVIALVLPYNLCRPDEIGNYWTQTRLPDDKFMSFDVFLNSINQGTSIGVASSAEPYPKPPELAYRDNTFIAWGNTYPQVVPPGYSMDMRSFGTLIETTGLNQQLPPWPAGSVDLCATGGN